MRVQSRGDNLSDGEGALLDHRRGSIHPSDADPAAIGKLEG